MSTLILANSDRYLKNDLLNCFSPVVRLYWIMDVESVWETVTTQLSTLQNEQILLNYIIYFQGGNFCFFFIDHHFYHALIHTALYMVALWVTLTDVAVVIVRFYRLLVPETISKQRPFTFEKVGTVMCEKAIISWQQVMVDTSLTFWKCI